MKQWKRWSREKNNKIPESVRGVPDEDLDIVNKVNKRTLFDGPTLLFICETKMLDSKCRWWKGVLGFAGMFVVNRNGRSGGLMLLWKDPFDVTLKSFTSGHIDCIIYHGEKMWRFTGFYGHPETACHHQSWELLCRLNGMTDMRGLSWLVGGDFNEICYDSEKLGGNPRPLNQSGAFRDTLAACSLEDLHGRGEFLLGSIEGPRVISYLSALIGTWQIWSGACYIHWHMHRH